MRLRIGARVSDLARLQAFEVGNALKAKHGGLEIEYLFKQSLGDKNLEDPLWKMPERGVFTEDFHQDLIDEKCDLVVHSWKDLPLDEHPHTEILGTLQRADQRDLLIVRKDRWRYVLAEKEMRVFSSSPRRCHNLTPFLKEALPLLVEKIGFQPVRGNIPTRIRKLFENEIDGLIVAKAAMDRLLGSQEPVFRDIQGDLRKYLRDCWWMVLPLEQNPTAAGQGALAIEGLKSRQDLRKLVDAISCRKTFRAVQEEREILGRFGGGCHQKIGVSVLQKSFGKIVSLRGLTDQGQALGGFSRNDESEAISARPSDAWPLENEGGSWFERENFELGQVSAPLWISKAEALPPPWRIPFDQPVWVSGWETWKKLARRGIWVHGSSESLGEERPALDVLAGERMSWTKLTHLESDPQSEMRILPTYKLRPKPDLPAIAGKKHFYWKSGSSFTLALDRFPEIRDAEHSCGPGKTHETIRSRLGSSARIHIFLSHRDWLKRVVK